MTYVAPCATVVRARFKDGGRACGHPLDQHERHHHEGYSYMVCRPCRSAGVRWTAQIDDAAGADHWYADGHAGARTPDA